MLARAAARLSGRAVAGGAFVATGCALAAQELPFTHAESSAADDSALRGAETHNLIEVLKTRLSSVSAEVEGLRARAAAEAARDAESSHVQRLLQRQEEEDSLKLLALLQQQEKVWESVTSDKLGEQAERLAVQHAEAARALTAELQQLHDHALARQADELAERYALEADALTLAEQASHEASRLAESAQRLARLAALRAEVEGLDAAYAFDSEYKSRAHAVHRLSAALFGLDGALRGGAAADSLSTSLAALKAAAPADELVRAALASLPPAVVSAERVQSCRELQVRFETVLSQGRVAAFVPEGSGIFGQLVGAFVALIAFKERGLVPPVDAAAIFARAEHYVHREQLGEAVAELATLRGLPRTVAQDWMDAASERVALEQALTLLRAHTTTLACALA